jgi:transcriptional regulator with XRE-family HTH domain
MNTKFKSAAEAAAQLAGNPEMAKAVHEEICRNSLVSALLSMRVAKNITQEKVAEAMHCDASKISRIESGNDRQLKWSDIVGYIGALDIKMSILFDDESLPAAARIKQCVFRIDEDLNALALMAAKYDGDDETVQKIDRFYKDVLFNFLKRYSDNRGKLNNYIKFPPQHRSAISEKCEPDDALEVKQLQPAGE